MRRAATFEVRGVEPDDLAWHASGPDARRAFWRAVVAFTLKAKDAELAAGLDRYGRALAPIKASTRKHRRSAMGPADPAAPPLTPAYGVSRTRLNLTGRAFADRAEFYWLDGWGKVLSIHRAGSRKRRLPKRDVIGLSPASLRKVERWALGWWANRGRAKAAAAQGPLGALPVLGRTDFRSFTYGISSGGGDQAAVSQALLAQGRSTGFFRRRPGQGLTGMGGPGNVPGVPRLPTGDASGRLRARAAEEKARRERRAAEEALREAERLKAERAEQRRKAKEDPAERFPGHTIAETDAAAFLEGSKYQGVLLHATIPSAVESLHENGIKLEMVGGAYGPGLYASSVREKGFGPATARAVVNARKPLIVQREKFWDVVTPWLAGRLDTRENMTEVFRERGYDMVILHHEETYQGPAGYNWVTLFEPDRVRFVKGE